MTPGRRSTGPDPLGLAAVSAEAVRASTEAMREAVASVGRAGEPVWSGPFAQVATRLREVARVDLCLARLVEGHADAHRILGQADHEPRPGVYGVWASRSAGTGARLTEAGAGARLHGEVRFASGVDVLDRALVPGWSGEEEHHLVDVDATAVTPDRTTWNAGAMDASRSFTVSLDVPVGAADLVGGRDFYLQRPGFVVGGLGVAAVWAGGAQSVVDLVADGLSAFPATAHQHRRLGRMAQAAWQAGRLVAATAELVDREAAGGGADGGTGIDLAEEIAYTRAAAVDSCELVVDEAARVVGPGGLTRNHRLARTLADLALYVRQHHHDSEHERLGARALAEATPQG